MKRRNPFGEYSPVQAKTVKDDRNLQEIYGKNFLFSYF